MTLNTIHHIAIICSDKDAALRFYHDILGFPIIRSYYREGRRDWKIDLAINEVWIPEERLYEVLYSTEVVRTDE